MSERKKTLAPDVFNYSSDAYDQYDYYPSNQFQRTSDHQIFHNYDHSNRLILSQVQYKQPLKLVGKQHNVEGNSFSNYVPPNQYQQKLNEYKYNIFSLIDEPWNRCCEVGTCGGCPGNEFVSSPTPKIDWL